MELNPDLPVQNAPALSPNGERAMPALAGGMANHEHSLDSALVTLEALGVGAHRIRLRRTGRDARPDGAIVRQSPPPSASLGADVRVELEIAGLGFTQALPVGMWDSGGEATAGTREILEVLDDPLDKLKHWFHEGAPLFRLAPDDLGACARWLTLFGFVPEEWPKTIWYRLASLVANLPQLACSEEGSAFVLSVLLDLPVRAFSYRPVWSALPENTLSRLGEESSRLGVDLLLGDRTEDLAITVLEIGPVALQTYESFVETEAGAALLRRVLELVMPLSTTYDVQWLVQDPSRPPQLGVPAANARLGVNSHMGTALPPSQEAELTAGRTPLDAVSSAYKVLGRDV